MAPPFRKMLSPTKKHLVTSMAQGTTSQEGRRTAIGYITLRIYDLIIKFNGLMQLVEADKAFLETPAAYTPQMRAVEMYLRDYDVKARKLLNEGIEEHYCDKAEEIETMYEQAKNAVSQYENIYKGFDFIEKPKADYPPSEKIMEAVIAAVDAAKKVIIPPPIPHQQLTPEEINLMNPPPGCSPLLHPSLSTVKHIMKRTTAGKAVPAPKAAAAPKAPTTVILTNEVIEAAKILMLISKN
jgi:hypothetical protein